MIKSTKYLKFLGMLTSATFTIIMLQTFAGNIVEHILYFIAGVIPEICKIILLLSGIFFYHRKKSLGVRLFIFFIPFFCTSLFASVSFVIHTVQKQMYEAIIADDENHNNNYYFIQEQANTIKANISNLETERTEERNRFNSLIDSLPVDHITRRR